MAPPLCGWEITQRSFKNCALLNISQDWWTRHHLEVELTSSGRSPLPSLVVEAGSSWRLEAAPSSSSWLPAFPQLPPRVGERRGNTAQQVLFFPFLQAHDISQWYFSMISHDIKWSSSSFGGFQVAFSNSHSFEPLPMVCHQIRWLPTHPPLSKRSEPPIFHSLVRVIQPPTHSKEILFFTWSHPPM